MSCCDANSCFFGHGKMSLYEKLLKSAEARSLISKCGEGLTLSDDVFNDIKSFAICYIYGDTYSSTLNQAHPYARSCPVTDLLTNLVSHASVTDQLFKQHSNNSLTYQILQYLLKVCTNSVGYKYRFTTCH